MKSSTTKVVIVKINGKKSQVVVDAAIYDDIYLEAATRFVEKQKGSRAFFNKIKILGLCYCKEDEERPENHQQVNLYHVLVNAAMYDLAELLREKTKNLHNVDLQIEPARSNAGYPPKL
jgi:uncharacterized membrane protein affecting hemolysin expression